MPSFEKLFLKSKGQPVVYKDRIIQMVDRLSVSEGQRLRVKFESVNSDWHQGIGLDTDGSFDVAGQRVKRKIVLWHHTAPRETLLTIHTKRGELLVKNIWDMGDGVMHSWHNGAAMIVEGLPKGRLYRCNDGRPDDDFDDLVFSIELVV
jgi:hypothetical protein